MLWSVLTVGHALAEAAMREDELRQVPVLVDLMAADLGGARTTARTRSRLEAAPASRVDRALLAQAARSAVVRPPRAPRLHGGRGA